MHKKNVLYLHELYTELGIQTSSTQDKRMKTIEVNETYYNATWAEIGVLSSTTFIFCASQNSTLQNFQGGGGWTRRWGDARNPTRTRQKFSTWHRLCLQIRHNDCSYHVFLLPIKKSYSWILSANSSHVFCLISSLCVCPNLQPCQWRIQDIRGYGARAFHAVASDKPPAVHLLQAL